MGTKTNKKDALNFEKAIIRLEEIIKQLDSGETELEQSLALYSESAELLAFCNKTLQQAELTIQKAFPDEKEEQDDEL